ncbi:hypothetical protein E2C01_077211 [Portunus trituberculatus]|uniref:Uncharacterized protein n=1 Tax=Portunus trituberculatus TaxID=210409 RepID=A0A5B7IKT3_PORTR|nr:hypothetical protein [Portunus trituberculatus]
MTAATIANLSPSHFYHFRHSPLGLVGASPMVVEDWVRIQVASCEGSCRPQTFLDAPAVQDRVNGNARQEGGNGNGIA